MDDIIDYNTEYAEYKRCKNCNRKTEGIEDYKNLRTNKITKTCKKCRETVYASYKKKPRIVKKKPTNKMIIESFTTFINQIDSNQFNEIINKPENKDLALLVEYRKE